MSRVGSTESGSVSSVTAGSIHAVSTSGRPGWALTRHVEVGRGEVEHRVRAAADPTVGSIDGVGRLRLVGAHQRAAAGVADDHDHVGAGVLPQPPHAGADVDERVLEEEEGLVAPVARVPAEEPDAALGERLGEVVLGEVDVVVGGDAGHPRSRARPAGGRGPGRGAARVRRGYWSPM